MVERRDRIRRVMGVMLHHMVLDELNLEAVRLQFIQEEMEELEPRQRRWWTRAMYSTPVRQLRGAFSMLMEELRVGDVPAFCNFLRMPPEMFDELLNRVAPRITKSSRWRKPHSPGAKLACTLRYMASGDCYHSMQYHWRIPHNSISKIVVEVALAIIDEYNIEVIRFPRTPEEWRAMAQRFGERWQFWHALGALDGKHVALLQPPNSGTTYHNYKKFFSIILMALVDADYSFAWIDVGTPGSAGDAQIFNNSQLSDILDSGIGPIPAPDPLPGDDRDMPYFIIGDDAFALKTWLMKPYSRRNLAFPKRVFNYRLSRARRVVENAFGILANRWRCLLTTMGLRPQHVQHIVHACVCLHNIMRARYPGQQNALLDVEDEDHNIIPGAWRQEGMLEELQRIGGNRMTREAKRQREYLKHYYVSPAGRVPWQERML